MSDYNERVAERARALCRESPEEPCEECIADAMYEIGMPETCDWCKGPLRGFAGVNDGYYCHEGDSPTCYELASAAAIAASLSLSGEPGGDEETAQEEER